MLNVSTLKHKTKMVNMVEMIAGKQQHVSILTLEFSRGNGKPHNALVSLSTMSSTCLSTHTDVHFPLLPPHPVSNAHGCSHY